MSLATFIRDTATVFNAPLASTAGREQHNQENGYLVHLRHCGSGKERLGSTNRVVSSQRLELVGRGDERQASFLGNLSVKGHHTNIKYIHPQE